MAMEPFATLIRIIGDPATKDDARLKAATEINESLDPIVQTSTYTTFLETVVPTLLKYLSEVEPQFVAEYPGQQTRKILLEIIHRFPINEALRSHVRNILNVIFKLIETDNEENVVICLRIVIELHKQFRPAFSPEVQQFLSYVKSVYKDLPSFMDKIFEPKTPIKVADINDLNLAETLDDIFAITSVQTEKKPGDTAPSSYNILPKARKSLKVLQELPIIVVLMYQIYKANVQTEVADFIPIVMSTITLQPNPKQKLSPSFNKEVLVEFMGAQVKTLSFLAYIIKLYQDLVVQHSQLLVSGLINLLTLCPMEVAYLRRELFIATRHIMATDLRFKFVPHMEKLFDEDILLGKGWTVNETMRPLAYSTLADLVHHVRQHLSLADLNRAVLFFSCHVHDESLPLSIQTMSCKLLFNLVESIRLKSEAEGGNGREILMRMLDVLVYKFKIVSEVHIPYFQEKYSKEVAASICGKRLSSEMDSSDDLLGKSMTGEAGGSGREESKRFGFPVTPMQNYSFTESRGLVKTVVCAVKTISWGIASCKGNTGDSNVPTAAPYKQFAAKETEVYLRLMKWGLKAIDIYAVNGPSVNPNGTTTIVPQRPINTQGVRSKEEKEVLEHFAGAFTLLNVYTFREIFSVSIELLVQRIHENNALQVVANNLLANPATSAVFATILVEFLLEKMPEMGEDAERSNLYLRLFKLVFGSVSLFPAENEQMLRPHLREIVNKSMELALNAKDPYNYFLLLRALFRSIGGGSHDLLYQEFLPLLPSLLQGLNNLQSGLHKQHMKDLFVELCLTVPVRLSSLLPYLPMLMDPLVSALNGSSTLISQGLRTLELCVDNLQPEFLYEHIQPVRADLMQALWRTLRNSNDNTAVVSFRILGKFGGSNRKMLVEPQKLEYSDGTHPGQCVNLTFPDHKTPVQLPLEKVVEVAVQTLRSATIPTPYDLYYKKQAWEFVKVFVLFSAELEMDRVVANKVILHPKISEADQISVLPIQRATDEKYRGVLVTALSGWLIATGIKELRKEVYTLLVPLLRHMAMVMTVQQTGNFAGRACNMDPFVVFDAMANVLATEEKDLKRPVFFGLSVILNCVINIMKSKDLACSLPMIEYMTEKFIHLCYERAWYTKMGGCQAVSFFLDNMSMRWLLSHQGSILRAMFFVLTDLTNEVSAGTIDLAKENLIKMLHQCISCTDENLAPIKIKCMQEMTLEFVKQLTSPITNIRRQSMKGLELLAEIQGKTVSAVMESHKDVLIDMIPPKKHLIRHQSLQCQLGILDGNAFCLSLRPKLFPLDVNSPEHKTFVSEVCVLSEADDSALTKLSCYKNVTNFVEVRKSLMKVLACVGPLVSSKEKSVHVFIKALTSVVPDVQICGFECLKKFMEEVPIEPEIQQAVVRPALTALTNMRTVTVQTLTQLSYLYQLFSDNISEKVFEQLLQIMRKCLELALVSHQKAPSRNGVHELKLAVATLSLFQLCNTQPLLHRLVEPLCKLSLQGEKALSLGKGCSLRQPLMKFILKQPQVYVNYVFSTPYVQLPEWNRFFIYFIQQKEAAKIRECLVNNPSKLIYFLNIKKNPVLPAAIPPNPNAVVAPGPPVTLSLSEQIEVQYFAVKIMSILSDYDEDWILGNGTNRGEVVQALRNLWESPEYQASCNSAVAIFMPSVPVPAVTAPDGSVVPPPAPVPSLNTSINKLQVQTWKEPHMIARLLLSYYRKNPGDYDMLFKLLLAFCGRTISQYHFLKDFLEKTVTKYSIPWKRQTFYEFVKVFQNTSYSEELKARIMQYILIPCFSYCFEKGQGDELIGSPPMPETDSQTNIVSVFIMKVIDPDSQNTMSDSVRILLCQFSCLLVDQASSHIHEAANKKQGNKLRRLMTFAWPCLLSKNCVDSSTKYYGHLLLSHIIAKFAIHKRIVLQVFHSLLKASLLEAKPVVKQALDIITPALPLRMEDGYTMLIHWTKKILVEEGHSLSQLMHLLQLIVRHWKVYYPVRHGLVQHMINGITRLGFTPTSTYDHRKLAVEMSEVIIKWELERIKNEGDDMRHNEKRQKIMYVHQGAVPHTKGIGVTAEQLSTAANKPIDKVHTDNVLNFLLRIACQVNESNPTPGSQGEILSKRCVTLIKTVLKPDVWKRCDLKMAWFDKLFSTLDSPQVNNPNICTALDLLTFIIGILEKEAVLEHMKSLQKGIIACMTCQNGKVIRAVHHLMTKLTSIFPTEFPGTQTQASTVVKYDELEPLYTQVSKVVYEGLNTYDKMSNANPQTLFGPLMMLKAACSNSPCYIDRIITPFMKCLQKLAREHLSPAVNDAMVATELLTLSLDLVKHRVGVMGVEMRKAFIGTVLVSLIEKSNDTKVMQAIIKMLDEWMKNKSPVIVNQGPSIREKSILLVKLMQNVEKRFPTDQELVALFLELINFIYRDENLKSTELNSKLEPAFLSGLRCTQPAIREKFFQVFDGSIRRKLHERLLYIVCSQNWEAMGPHYWVKQCEELLFATASDIALDLVPKDSLIPSVTYGYSILEPQLKEIFVQMEPDLGPELREHELAFVQQLEKDLENLSKTDENDETSMTEIITRVEDAFMKEGWIEPAHPDKNMKYILTKEKEFIASTRKGYTTASLVKPMVQLCHLDTPLAEKIWISFFPRAWKIFTEKQQLALANEMVPFLCSGVHVLQQNCQPSAMSTFVEALCQCIPSIPIKPAVLFYLGKTQNLWHRMGLLLEQLALDCSLTPQLKTKKDSPVVDCYEFEPSATPGSSTTTTAQQQEILDSLSELYSSLKEEDLWAGLWQRRAKYPETNIGIAFELQGYYEKAQGCFELAMGKAKGEISNSASVFGELKLWEDHWLKCAKELNQWEVVSEYSGSKPGANPFGVLEAAWRGANWATVKEALSQVELGCPKDMAWKVNLFRGYLSICSSEDQNLTIVDRYVETAQNLCIREWKRLPHLVSPVHIPLLQAAQQVVELHEATLIHQALLHGRQNTMHETKSVVKTWRNRLPCISDDLSHWSDIFTWRQLHYQFVAQHFVDGQAEQSGNQTMLGVHASAQVQIHNFSVHQYCQATVERLKKQFPVFPSNRQKQMPPANVLLSDDVYWQRLTEVMLCGKCQLRQPPLEFKDIKQRYDLYDQNSQLLNRQTMEDTENLLRSGRITPLPERATCVYCQELIHYSYTNKWRKQFQDTGLTGDLSRFTVVCDTMDKNSWCLNMLYCVSSNTAICHFGKIARKHNQTSVCLESLSKIYTIPSVPIVDCFQKIKQQVKCYIQQAQILGRNELSEALEIVESTNLKYFSKEMTSEFFSLKGSLLSQIGRSEEANKAFSAACQMHDAQAKSWGLWGDYLEGLFTKDPRNLQLGISAITAFMHACRHNQESKARKYIAKILWLLMYDDDKGALADTVDKYCIGVPPIQWLPWVPQLLVSLGRHDGKMIINLLNQVGRMYPQAVYFPIRTLYLTLKVEQREKVRSNEQNVAAAVAQSMISNAAKSPQRVEGSPSAGESVPNVTQQPQASQPEAQAIKATPSMWRCSRIMHMQRDLHPTILSNLEGIIDQIIWFRENWYEEVLRQLKIGLGRCYAISFENRSSSVLEASLTTPVQNFVKKLVSTFGHTSPVGTATALAPGTSGTPTIEALLRRSSNHDPTFQQMKIQFTVDFDSSAPGSMKLHNLIQRLKKWIKILEGKTKMFPKSFLMEDRYRFLLNFNNQIADIELPGECLIPKHAHYYVKIARFQPKIEVVQKHNTSARRIYIRGHNGKTYPYLIVNDSYLTDARRDERVMQMIRMLNHYLGRQKNTAKRNLRFTVPKVAAVSPQMRLVEDNPASLSLYDVFKSGCAKRQIEFDAAIGRYYERIASVQSRGAQVSHQVLREILRDIQTNLVPRTMVREWALSTFSTPSDYWTFRRIFTLQLCLSSFAEYAFHLTRLNPDMMYLHKDSGMVNISYFKFEVDDSTGELDSNRPVPFRLTPNISEFITSFGINGPVVSGMIALARCLVYPNYKLQAILRAILRDEMIAWMKKKQDDRDVMNNVRGQGQGEPLIHESDAEAVISMVTKSVSSIVTRLQTLSSFDGTESKVTTLVAAANSHDNLCRMDPTYLPWL